MRMTGITWMSCNSPKSIITGTRRRHSVRGCLLGFGNGHPVGLPFTRSAIGSSRILRPLPMSACDHYVDRRWALENAIRNYAPLDTVN